MPVALREVSEAVSLLPELVRQVEAGAEIVLTRDGQRVARLVAENVAQSRAERRAILERFQRNAARNITPGPSAARSQDFLYDDDGLPA